MIPKAVYIRIREVSRKLETAIRRRVEKAYPDLPLHDESTTNERGSSFGTVDGDSGRLGSDTQTENETV